MRKADELSTTTAPRSMAIGAHSRERVAPAEKMAMSTPSKASASTARTSSSSSPNAHARAGAAGAGEADELAEVEVALGQHLAQHLADGAGGAQDGNAER